MSLNINTALYSAQGVDVNNASKVANQILQKASQNQEPTVKAIDYSKFNRAVLGIDLYSSRTNTDLQKQIAFTQAGLYAQSVDVAKLNSQAAMNLYSAQAVQKAVENAQSIQYQELVAPAKIQEQNNAIQLFSLNKDKNSHSSQSFNPFLNNDDNNEDNHEPNISLFI